MIGLNRVGSRPFGTSMTRSLLLVPVTLYPRRAPFLARYGTRAVIPDRAHFTWRHSLRRVEQDTSALAFDKITQSAHMMHQLALPRSQVLCAHEPLKVFPVLILSVHAWEFHESGTLISSRPCRTLIHVRDSEKSSYCVCM